MKKGLLLSKPLIMFVHNILMAYSGRVRNDDGYVCMFSLLSCKNKDNYYSLDILVLISTIFR